MSSQHTLRACVCVPHTPPTGKLVRLYLQPLLPCSCPVIGWALFRLTRLQSDRLMRRTPPHTHLIYMFRSESGDKPVWAETKTLSWSDISCRRSASFVYVNVRSLVVVDLWRWSARPCEIRRGKRRADVWRQEKMSVWGEQLPTAVKDTADTWGEGGLIRDSAALMLGGLIFLLKGANFMKVYFIDGSVDLYNFYSCRP